MKNFEELAFEWYDTICFSDKYAYRTEKMNAIKHLVSFFGKMNCEAIKSADVDRFIKYESEHLNPNNGTRTVVYHIDADRLYRDSVAYNEKLKTHQYDLLINEHSYQQASLDLYDYGVPNNIYGYISATSIDMELPIYLGASEDNMAVGAAHLTNTSLPIGGKSTNCVLAAHTGYIGRVFFDYIRYLNIGDEITITNFWDTLSYRVTDKQIYKKYESSNCYITDGKDLLTLITCAHGGADRYYVLCERVDNLSTY